MALLENYFGLWDVDLHKYKQDFFLLMIINSLYEFLLLLCCCLQVKSGEN